MKVQVYWILVSRVLNNRAKLETNVVSKNVMETAALLFGFLMTMTRVQKPKTSIKMPSIIK